MAIVGQKKKESNCKLLQQKKRKRNQNKNKSITKNKKSEIKKLKKEMRKKKKQKILTNTCAIDPHLFFFGRVIIKHVDYELAT